MPPETKLSIIILTWNSREMLKECLNSVHASLRLKEFEIIVVDNGSRDGTGAMLREHFPEVTVIANSTNRGVAPARNQGLEIAKGNFLLFLDVDTIIPGSAIDTLIEYLGEHPRVGLVGPMLLYPEGELQYSCRRFPTIWTKLLRRVPIHAVESLLAEEQYRDWDHTTPRRVDYVIGACQLIRREAFEETGYLDGAMFYGPEDVDYCLRLARLGWDVVYDPHAVVIHKEQRVTKRRLFSKVTWKHVLALKRYFWKHRYGFSRKRLYARLQRGNEEST
jgi:hypothetical protein